ncbi:GntR family transcriptional regulator [Pollutimonas thiosulfatoxidans]|uniref:GntR family transcriptional regulator n=1 Tax=Pollutimonas thiosulfatoxidans TaxID=2028345 RepID=A0A410G8E3_9BURK|nr:GntR family transcriptional regulator [Pollutimonas thiosulfatoxidans]QAA92546.1 GntR family transcriptional regulator [Pollutimonas thiosulfatoxidans]
MSFLDSKVPRYLQLADLMRQRITRGEWPKDHKLPTLEDLLDEFGVARATVRQALDVLAREGLVSRQRGRGTFVTKQPKTDRWINVVTSLQDLSNIYRDTQPSIVNIDEASRLPLLHANEGTPAPHYVFMRRVHYRESAAYCVINIYLDEDVFKKDPARFRQETVIPLLASIGNLADGHQTLTIGTADMEVARLLNLPFNAPVAEVRRVLRDAGNRIIYLAEVTYRGDAIRVEMDLKT